MVQNRTRRWNKVHISLHWLTSGSLVKQQEGLDEVGVNKAARRTSNGPFPLHDTCSTWRAVNIRYCVFHWTKPTRNLQYDTHKHTGYSFWNEPQNYRQLRLPFISNRRNYWDAQSHPHDLFHSPLESSSTHPAHRDPQTILLHTNQYSNIKKVGLCVKFEIVMLLRNIRILTVRWFLFALRELCPADICTPPGKLDKSALRYTNTSYRWNSWTTVFSTHLLVLWILNGIFFKNLIRLWLQIVH